MGGCATKPRGFDLSEAAPTEAPITPHKAEGDNVAQENNIGVETEKKEEPSVDLSEPTKEEKKEESSETVTEAEAEKPKPVEETKDEEPKEEEPKKAEEPKAPTQTDAPLVTV